MAQVLEEKKMAHELPPLPYDYTALEPTIDEKTMHLHHDMHHAAYVKNLNAALDKHPELHKKNAEDLIRDLNAFPEDIRGAVRNNGGAGRVATLHDEPRHHPVEEGAVEELVVGEEHKVVDRRKR